MVGGLVGLNESGEILDSLSDATVDGQTKVGGLVGHNDHYVGPVLGITNSAATGDVTGDDLVGGLIGRNAGTVADSYATGGLVASGDEATKSYWDEVTTGEDESVGGTPLTTAEFGDDDNFVDWDFNDVWTIDEAPDGHDRPIFQWQD